MDDKVFDSIVEITKHQDSDEFGLSIVAAIAEIVPHSTVALIKYFKYPSLHYDVITTLSIQRSLDGTKQYLWNNKLSAMVKHYIDQNFSKLSELTVIQIKDDLHNNFIPIYIENEIAFAINICSTKSFTSDRNTILAVIKVCQNFYSILACSEKDSLTGLLNRRTYDQKLNILLKKQYSYQHGDSYVGDELRVHQTNSFTWLAIIDIDFFKKVNDKFGHVYGDEVLLLLSQLMLRAFRHNDLLFRFGGEEFVLIFEPIQKEQAELILDKFRIMVEKYLFPMVGHITISCGYAKISEKDHPKTVFDNADKALYYAKEHGRNCVCNYETLLQDNLINSTLEEGGIELF